MIRIYCDAADAWLRETQTLTAGMINYPEVLLTFSDDWDGYGKAVIVRAGTVEKAALIVNNKFVVPSECLAESGVNLIVGISGSDGVHTIPTIWCSCGEIMDGTDVQDSTAIGEATPALVDQMLGYAQDVVDEAQMLKNYIIKTVAYDNTNANQFGNTEVTIDDSGEGENRTLTFYFRNIKGRGISKLLFTQSGENKGRLQVQLEGEEPVNFDGVKEALSAIETALSEAGTSEAERETAENAREVAEEQRDLAEQGRESAEHARDTAESNRQSAESTRDANEATRIANETTRETNENTRQSNEQSRVEAEADRAAEFHRWETVDQLNGLKSEGYAVGKANGEDVGSDSPYYQNNAKYYAEYAEDQKDDAVTAKNTADARAVDSESWAVGERNGIAVVEGDDTFHNNSKFYADVAGQGAASAGYMYLYINDDGHLIMERSSNVDEDFRIDSNGHLIWEVS